MMFTSEDVRIFLQDYKEANLLLDELEFTPEQIKTAIKHTLWRFNEIPPLIPGYVDEKEFPFPFLLLMGVSSHLLISSGLKRTRNRLQFTSNGISVDDQSMADVYLNLGNMLKSEFDQKAQQLKISENVKKGFGNVPSEYSFMNTTYRSRR